MLVISLKPGESAHIGDSIKLQFRGVIFSDAAYLFSITGSGVTGAHGLTLPDGSQFGVEMEESFSLGRCVTVHVTRHDKRHGSIRIAIDAPREITILRDKHLATA